MKNRIITAILAVLGSLAVIACILYVVFGEIAKDKDAEAALSTASEIAALLPKEQKAPADEELRRDMPCLNYEGEDYIALLQISSVDSTLPIGAYWEPEEIEKHPRRLAGSLYFDTLIIGGSDNRGQFDFAKTVSLHDTVTVTDMTGTVHTFKITDIYNTKDVSVEALTEGKAPLVLFTRNTYGFDYTVIVCDEK